MMIFILFMVGTIFGSFFGLVIERLPAGASIVTGRSHCGSCQTQLAVRDLVPIVSQILNRSRCRYCQVKLPIWYAGLEFSCGILFGAAGLGALDLPQFLLLVMSLILSIFDSRSHSFPFSVWLIFACIFILLFPSNLTEYFWLILAALAAVKPLKIGSGDFLWLFIASFSLTFLQMAELIQIASLLGILYFLFKKPREIPFIPFLTIAYLILLMLVKIP